LPRKQPACRVELKPEKPLRYLCYLLLKPFPSFCYLIYGETEGSGEVSEQKKTKAKRTGSETLALTSCRGWQLACRVGLESEKSLRYLCYLLLKPFPSFCYLIYGETEGSGEVSEHRKTKATENRDETLTLASCRGSNRPCRAELKPEKTLRYFCYLLLNPFQASVA
jgi:hypothetical protein